MTVWTSWTIGAIDCYRRGGQCKGCPTYGITEEKCVMKQSVIELVRQFGAPPPEVKGLFEGITYVQNEIINAILSGLSTKAEIAKKTGKTQEAIQTWLSQLYLVAQANGYVFKTKRKRLPEFVKFVRQIAREREDLCEY